MNQEVAAILISELAQALPQRFDQPAILCKRPDAEKTDLVDCARALRACGAWHGHRCARNRRNELPPPHEHLPRERTLLLSRVKHDRTRYAIGPHFSFRFLPLPTLLEAVQAADREGRSDP